MRQKKEQGKSTGRFVDIYIYIYTWTAQSWKMLRSQEKAVFLWRL